MSPKTNNNNTTKSKYCKDTMTLLVEAIKEHLDDTVLSQITGFTNQMEQT